MNLKYLYSHFFNKFHIFVFHIFHYGGHNLFFIFVLVLFIIGNSMEKIMVNTTMILVYKMTVKITEVSFILAC